MNLLTAYYHIKPAIPRRIQISSRRAIASYKKRAIKNIWPIHPEAAGTPFRWGGWPDHKKFALILSHDVDSAAGRDRCCDLMEMERDLGYRSAFNFVAEDYQIPKALFKELERSGFEIGLHGLRHDGKLFSTKRAFYESIPRINHYLKNWRATGFRSPSTLRNLEWIADLDIEYDSSTFDTDPFEPQPDGMKTIFPFWIENRAQTHGYVEFPYTLPQDHCLFIILKEKNIGIWKKKLEWIAEKGGMAFLNTHPDYMRFRPGRLKSEEYPSALYRDFLVYVRERYDGQYWHALPREAAGFWKKFTTDVRRSTKEDQSPGEEVRATPTGIKIWIDLDNTPHVPFFLPIIRELERRGHQLILTARDAFQVCQLADEKGLPYIKIGHHYGKNPILKVFGLLWRSGQLAVFFLQHKPDVALSHGSRSQVLYSNLLRIPSIVITDYEHAQTVPFAHSRWSIVPDVLTTAGLASTEERIRHYRGIKEDVYVPGFAPDLTLLETLGLNSGELIVTVRPPADEAHYSNPKSDLLLFELMKRLLQVRDIRAVILPRNFHQEQIFKVKHPDWFKNDKTIIPPKAVDGLSLLWLSDLVVSGGGTMNREAAALGVPAYSIFCGKMGNVDRMLEREGRLVMIHSAEEVWAKIPLARRDKALKPEIKPRRALQDIVDQIEDIIKIEKSQ